MSQEETKPAPITDRNNINHPERKALRQGFSAYLHAAIDEWATMNGGMHHVDVAVVLANMTGSVAAQGCVLPQALHDMLDNAYGETSIALAQANQPPAIGAKLPDGVTKN